MLFGRRAGQMIYWHYTTGVSLWAILASRAIEPYRHDFKLPNIWLTKKPTWDWAASRHTHTKDNRLMSPEEMSLTYGGLYRIGVDDGEVSLLRWPEIGKAAGMPQWIIDIYLKGGGDETDHSDWAGTFEAIPARFWRSLERGDATGELWIPLDTVAMRGAIRAGLELTLESAKARKLEIENEMATLKAQPEEVHVFAVNRPTPPERRISSRAFAGLVIDPILFRRSARPPVG